LLFAHIRIDVHGCTNSASARMRRSCYFRSFAFSFSIIFFNSLNPSYLPTQVWRSQAFMV